MAAGMQRATPLIRVMFRARHRSMYLAKGHLQCRLLRLPTMPCSGYTRSWICPLVWGRNTKCKMSFPSHIDPPNRNRTRAISDSMFSHWEFKKISFLFPCFPRLAHAVRSVSPKRWYNVIDATPNGIICLEADLTSQDADVRFQWTGGQIIINRPPWSQKVGVVGSRSWKGWDLDLQRNPKSLRMRMLEESLTYTDIEVKSQRLHVDERTVHEMIQTHPGPGFRSTDQTTISRVLAWNGELGRGPKKDEGHMEVSTITVSTNSIRNVVKLHHYDHHHHNNNNHHNHHNHHLRIVFKNLYQNHQPCITSNPPNSSMVPGTLRFAGRPRQRDFRDGVSGWWSSHLEATGAPFRWWRQDSWLANIRIELFVIFYIHLFFKSNVILVAQKDS